MKNLRETGSGMEKLLSLILILSLMLSGIAVPVSAEWSLEDLNPTPNSAELYGHGYDVQTVISLAEDQTGLVVTMPTTMTAEEAAKKDITYSLVRNDDRAYLDPKLFPNQSAGGAIDSWTNEIGDPIFKVTSAAVRDGILTVTFDAACYFIGFDMTTFDIIPDYSVSHSPGGAYLDLCGYFTFTAAVNGKEIGGAEVKVVPYQDYHTMDEIYVRMEELAGMGSTNGLYVSKASMGKSTTGRDMPYLIISDRKSSVDAWLKFTETAETDPTKVLEDIQAGVYDDIRVPAMYTNIHPHEAACADGVLRFAEMIIDAGLNGTLNYRNLTGFTAEGKAELKAEKDSIHAAVPELIADKATFLGYIRAGNEASGKVDIEKYYTSETINVKVSDLLQDIFFILVPTENVDGRTFMTRVNANGIDLNRDNAYQTQIEAVNIQRLIGTYNPVSVSELHGRVNFFQCEPCTPPHDPNCEYDLLSDHLITGGEAFGIAAVANNDSYNSYIISQRDLLTDMGDGTTDWVTPVGPSSPDWVSPWNDMFAGYTPQFAMLHGSVAYTMEVPAYNDEVVRSEAYGILGQANYIAGEKLGYLTSQVSIFERGVKNLNSDGFDMVGQWLCDRYDVEGAEADIFRPEYTGKGQNGNFYPECYIIPMDGTLQKNLREASDMLTWLTRNDVKVNISAAPFDYDGVTYPAGTAIVSMYQAKRSVANCALYKGTWFQDWPSVCSGSIASYSDTNGFDLITVAEPSAYKTISAVMGTGMDDSSIHAYLDGKVTSFFTGVTGGDVILSNSSIDSVAAVNALLRAGKPVGFITDGEYIGSFICKYADYKTVDSKFILSAKGVKNAAVTANLLNAPIVYVPCVPSADSSAGFAGNSQVTSFGYWNDDTAALRAMGFETTENLREADVIVGGTGLEEDEIAAVKKGTAYLGFSSDASDDEFVCALVEGSHRVGLENALDLMAYVTYPAKSMITASFAAEGDDLLYGVGYGYFASIPEGAEVLVKMNPDKTPRQGFIPTDTQARKNAYQAFLKNGVLAYAYRVDGLNIALFANSLNEGQHQHDEYTLIANFIFANSMSSQQYTSVRN